MADLKISALAALATLQDADLFVVVDDSEVSAVKNKKLTWSTLKAMISSELGSNFALADLSNTNLVDESAGDLLYYTGSAWDNLPKGTPGYFLKSTAGGLEWAEVVGGGGGISHATADGNYYASKDGDWAQFEPGISDADSNGTAYGRKDGAWTEVLEGLNDGNATAYNPWDKAVDMGGQMKNSAVVAGDIITLGNEFLDFGAGFNGNVEDIKVDNYGRIYVCGAFTTYKGDAAAYICRLLRSGTLDPDFNIGTFGTVTNVLEIHFLADGRILWAGRFREYDGHSAVGLLITDIDGNVDTSFTSSITSSFSGNPAISADVQSDGKIVAVGRFSELDGATTVNRIARFNTDGSTDAAFLTNVGDGPNDLPWRVRIDANDKIYVGGQFTEWDGETHRALVRLNSDGTLDAGFDTGAGFTNTTDTNHDVWDIAIQEDLKVICGGDFKSYQGVAAASVIRLNTDGSRDTTFDMGTGFENLASCVAIKVMASGNIILGGNPTIYNGDLVGGVFVVDATGALIKSFRGFPGSVVWAVESDVTGKVLAGGTFTSVTVRDDDDNSTGTYSAGRIAVFMPTGEADSNEYGTEYVNLAGERGNLLHTQTRYLKEPETLGDLDLVYLKKVVELMAIEISTKRVQATISDGDTPELDCDSGTEVYFTWEGSNSTPDVNIVNSIVNSVLQISYRKVTAGDVTIKLAGDDLKFVLEGNATPAATLDIVLSGAENSYWSINGAVTGHTNGYDTDKVVTVTYKQ